MSKEELASQEYIYDPEFKDKRTGASSGSILFNFITNLRLGMDLTSITCPSFMLRPASQLEVQAELSQPTIHLFQLKDTSDAAERMLNVVQWILHGVSALPQKGLDDLKPYNPVLGEEYHCQWNYDDGSVTNLVAEQVSHHPPISATILRNEKHGITYNSTQQIKVHFRGNYVDSTMEGVHVLDFKHPETGETEKYTITLPHVNARGLFFGSTYVELSDYLIINCIETNCVAKVKFLSSDEVQGHVSCNGKKRYSLKGGLFDVIKIKDKQTGEKKELRITEITTPKTITRKVSEQKPNESRRVWHPVSYALKNGEMEQASKEKNNIEEQQRKMARERTTPHVPLYFAKKEGTEDGAYVYLHDKIESVL